MAQRRYRNEGQRGERNSRRATSNTDATPNNYAREIDHALHPILAKLSFLGYRGRHYVKEFPLHHFSTILQPLRPWACLTYWSKHCALQWADILACSRMQTFECIEELLQDMDIGCRFWLETLLTTWSIHDEARKACMDDSAQLSQRCGRWIGSWRLEEAGTLARHY